MSTAPILPASAPALSGDVVLTPFGPGDGLPLFVQPQHPELTRSAAAAREWFEDNRQEIERLLIEFGAVVLRGFAIPDTTAFGALIAGYESPDFGYSGGASPRSQIEGRVFEATRAPAEAVLGMHQEMAYLPHFPSRLAFYCRIAPASGGETFIADMRKLTARIDGGFLARVAERGVLYTRNFRAPDHSIGHPLLDAFHKTWCDAFFTIDPAKAEADCAAMGLDARWLDDGSLSVAYRSRGLIEHPQTGETLWFNQIATQSLSPENLGDRFPLYDQFYGTDRPRAYATSFGDGSPISREDLAGLYPVLNGLIVAFPWSQGDVMLLDNFLTAHGRNCYTGRRDVQVALLS